MKAGNRSNVLRYIIGGYCLIYLAMLISEASYSETGIDDYTVSKATLIRVVFSFVIFLAATIYAWFNERLAGILKLPKSNR